MQSAAHILNSPQFWEANSDARKFVHHRFQDLGYRIAVQLGDLSHRSIYMRLAKVEDSYLLEQALNFVSDYNTHNSNKGRLFMWKLQQLREARQLEALKRDFRYSTIAAHMRVVNNMLAPHIHAKHLQQQTAEREAVLHEFAAKVLATMPKTKAAPTILDWGCYSGLDAQFLGRLGFKVKGLETAKNLVTLAKRTAEKRVQFVTKTALLPDPSSIKPVHGVWLGRMWSTIPQDDCASYVAALGGMIKPGGWLAVAAHLGDGNQAWHEFTWQEKTYLRFERTSTPEFMAQLAQQAGFAEQIVRVLPEATIFLWRRA